MITNLKTNINNFINNISIRNKLYLAFLFIITIPALIFGTIVYHNSSYRLEEQFIRYAQKSFEQASIYMESKINNITNVTDTILVDNRIIDFLKYQPEKYDDSYIIQNEKMNKVSQVLYSYERSQGVVRICLYVQDGLMYSNENVRFFSISKLIQNGMIDILEKQRNKLYWFPPERISIDRNNETEVIPALFRIKDPYDFNKTLGVCRIDLPEKEMGDILDRAKVTPSAYAAIFNNNDETIVSTDITKVSELLKYAKSSGKEKKEYSLDSVKIGNDNALAISDAIKGTDWRLYLVIPYKDIVYVTKSTRNEVILFIIVLYLLAYFFIVFISGTITSRISKLVRQMKQSEKGDFSKVSIQYCGRDEVGQLSTNFNYLLVKISNMIEERYNMGREVKNSELKALQAQINPHFLYNTLELIKWMATENKTYEIKSIVHALAKFYKLSLSRGEDIIPLRDEIEHIRTYVQIQNARFENCIKLTIDIKEEFLDIKIIKLVLQPIVENSILHGILEKDEGKGTIVIKAEEYEDDLMLFVSDNGRGMDDEQIERILTADNDSGKKSYGIFNVNRRLEVYYGERYGLNYSSKRGIGTTVTIKIAKLAP